MDERDKKTELLVGLFLTIGLALLGLLVLQFGSVREYFKDTYEITVPFPDGTGIKAGTPVMLGGSKIGKVPRMPQLNAQFNGVIIPLEIYHDKRIPADAKFAIGTAGLLGDSFIEISPTGAPTGAYIEPGASLPKDNVSSGGGLGAPLHVLRIELPFFPFPEIFCGVRGRECFRAQRAGVHHGPVIEHAFIGLQAPNLAEHNELAVLAHVREDAGHRPERNPRRQGDGAMWRFDKRGITQ